MSATSNPIAAPSMGLYYTANCKRRKPDAPAPGFIVSCQELARPSGKRSISSAISRRIMVDFPSPVRSQYSLIASHSRNGTCTVMSLLFSLRYLACARFSASVMAIRSPPEMHDSKIIIHRQALPSNMPILAHLICASWRNDIALLTYHSNSAIMGTVDKAPPNRTRRHSGTIWRATSAPNLDNFTHKHPAAALPVCGRKSYGMQGHTRRTLTNRRHNDKFTPDHHRKEVKNHVHAQMLVYVWAVVRDVPQQPEAATSRI